MAASSAQTVSELAGVQVTENKDETFIYSKNEKIHLNMYINP